MGWFWDTPSAGPARQTSSYQLHRDNSRLPPPECPMHQKSAIAVEHNTKAPDAACPYTPGDSSRTGADSRKLLTLSKLNPLNYMFAEISQDKAPTQKVALDTEREPSTIPKGSGDGNWEYPSPQQMYNALLRKGHHDTDPEHVTAMVSVHNFLNEGAWKDICIWEGLFSQGLEAGWRKCAKGEAGIEESIADDAQPKLIRFQGRPKDMTPRAAMVQMMGMIYPSKFKTEPPFDRHDWYVERKNGDTVSQIRYVIDYYEGDDEPTGEPTFFLDVRPAIDSPTIAMERLTRWGRDIWYRASGASVREEQQ